MGCGAKLRWVDDKFVLYEGTDFAQRRDGNKKQKKKDCIVCQKQQSKTRFCRQCKEVVCFDCIEKCENKCPQCWENSAFWPSKV